ncbi:hypothetical protein KJS94_02855 [Flavihumibacter rivuli]|uniref:hypothetical protein n=1 Tax=Flavihumibacter rivuli TaxID=2838156 RepID=UPI001BDE8146|nr:hypothetical protein [Flavihumibacter rivuli]ULQ57136.1 hypothetical protein KJS94_02855 [Flavihumibacter rivuli]
MPAQQQAVKRCMPFFGHPIIPKFKDKYFPTLKKFNKRFFYTLLCLIISFCSFSQDGSDIRYVKTVDLNETHVGPKVQFDFYNRSFGGIKIDTVLIAVTDKSIKFVEHRDDDGFNNWFYRQYLESIDSIGNFKLRLIYSKIKALTRDEIRVINYFNLYDKNNEPLFDTPFTKQNSYRRKSIVEVLITGD